MRIRTLEGPPLEHEIIRDVLRSILLTDPTVSARDRGDVEGLPNSLVMIMRLCPPTPSCM